MGDKNIFILCDLEGVSGVVNFDTDTAPGQVNYKRSLRLATNELNALIRGLRKGGADKIAVLDGHGYGGIDIELIEEDADIYLGRPIFHPFDLDKNWDGMVLFAHHAMAGTPNANLCHSWSHTTIYEVRLNNKPIGEIGWYTYLATYYRIPVILVTGDDKACMEAKKYVPNIETAVVKKGLNTNAAICKPPRIAQKIIENRAEKAMAKIDEIMLANLPTPPYKATRIYLDPIHAETFCEKRPWAKRIDSRTISVESTDYLDLTKKFL